MELIISISNDEKAGALVEFLRVLDFVESIRTQGDDRILEMETPPTEDFFAVAGIWEKRPITQESIRTQAWPVRS